MLILLAALALSAPPGPPALEGTRWTLVGLTPNVTLDSGRLRVPGPRVPRPAFTIRRGRLTGTTGCSPLRARVTVNGAAVRVWDVQAGTSDRCPDHALALREDFTALLAQVSGLEWRGRTLVLNAGAGRLEFSAPPAP